MEKRIQQKANEYVINLKNELEVILLNCNSLSNEDKVKLENFLNSYQTLKFDKEDFQRRKRSKNVVPFYERCNAKRANEERCTRRRKENSDFCGTHSKGQPHGVIVNDEVKNVTKKIVLRTQDIKGIIYYIDDFNNVYNSAEILSGSKKPNIIAKYVKNNDGSFSIPSFNI